jgi:predicted transcriptional regulator
MRRPVSRATSLWVVLRAVWTLCQRQSESGDDAGAVVPDIVQEAIEIGGRPIAYTTVATQLKMLEDKKLVRHVKRGRNLHYYPTVDEVDAVRREVDVFLDNILHDDPALLEMAVERISRRLRLIQPS